MRKKKHSLRVIYIELIAFAIIICVSWGDELFNAAHLLFGGDYSSNWHEAFLETCVTILVATPTVLLTFGIVKKLHYLEDFLKVCAWCRKVNEDDQWYTLEEYFDNKFGTISSHGICPACHEKLMRDAELLIESNT